MEKKHKQTEWDKEEGQTAAAQWTGQSKTAMQKGTTN